MTRVFDGHMWVFEPYWIKALEAWPLLAWADPRQAWAGATGHRARWPGSCLAHAGCVPGSRWLLAYDCSTLRLVRGRVWRPNRMVRMLSEAKGWRFVRGNES